MSKGIVLTPDEINTEEVITVINPFPINLLDHRSPTLSPQLKKKILFEKYKNRIIADGIETGQLVLTEDGSYRFFSKQSASSLTGFIFEAYLVDKFNLNRNSRLTAFQWATERSTGWSTSGFEGYIAVGTGLLTTKNKYVSHYEPQSNADIIFLRKNPLHNVMEYALVHKQQIQAQIQVKSINGNFKQEIIGPVLSGKYQRVITMLSDAYGEPSWKKCHTILSNMKRAGTLSIEEHSYATERIQGPEFFSLSQLDVNDYYEFIQDWYTGRVKRGHEYTEQAVEQEISQYKYENGLLVPL
ncbi:hypothetical protein [Providencia manganoxydans]|uniref:hypothetical protein n=1 Tax=Providencia manganoxydans TaxID=2923283 RepID=UPI0034E4233A